MEAVALSLGSNKKYFYEGVERSPQEILLIAVEKLSKILKNCSVSSVYETKPMYLEDQENFTNIAVFGFFEGSPSDLLQKTQEIETELGRNRLLEVRNGPRSLDIDILLFSSETVNTEHLSIPHPRMTERAFVLVPMLEILPKNADNTVRDYYEKCLNALDKDVIKKVSL